MYKFENLKYKMKKELKEKQNIKATEPEPEEIKNTENNNSYYYDLNKVILIVKNNINAKKIIFFNTKSPL